MIENTEKTDWFVLHNPSSGGGLGKRDWHKIEKLLNHSEINFIKKATEYKAHAIDIITKALDKNYHKFIVVGGDGSLNETINAIINYGSQKAEQCVIGYLPVGTGNDWAKTMKIPAGNYPKALQIILNKQVLRQDVGLVTCTSNGQIVQRYFMNIAGIGFGGYVSRGLDNSRANGYKPGKLSYLWSVLKGMFKYKAERLKFYFNNEVKDSTLYFGAIAIGKFFGGGMQPAPHAHPADDLFEVTIVDKLKPLKVLRALRNFYSGKIGHYKEVNFYKTKNVEVKSDHAPLLIETDGEFIGQTPATFELISNKINVIINNQEYL